MCPLFMYLFTHVMNKTALRNVHDWLENFDDMVKYINCTCRVLVKYVWFTVTAQSAQHIETFWH